MMSTDSNGSYAVSTDDVRQRFGDEPFTADDVLQALASATMCHGMDVDSTTPDDELDAFLFAQPLK